MQIDVYDRSKVFIILGVNEDRSAHLGTRPPLAPCFERDGMVFRGVFVCVCVCVRVCVSVEAIFKSPLHTGFYIVNVLGH